MTQTVVSRLVGRALCYSMYKCYQCGRVQNGTGFEVAVDTNDYKSVDNLTNFHPTPYNMPVGWSSYHESGNIVFRCDECKITSR